MKNYINSKFKIFKLQNRNQFSLVNKEFKSNFKKRNLSGRLIVPDISKYKKFKLKIKNHYLSSSINDENMSNVFSLIKLLKIDEKIFVKLINTFKVLPHRYEIFLKKRNYCFINDSKATSFQATKYALRNTKNIFWIVGGLPKKNDTFNLSKVSKNIVKCYIIGKNINFFKRQITKKVKFVVTDNLKNSIIQIFKDIKKFNLNKNNILLSPASASFDQFSNFEKRGEKFKILSRFYTKNIFKLKFKIIGALLTKKFFCFVTLFFRSFFSFSSTSSLAGERLNKDYYFFFSKHLIFTLLALFIMFSLSILETSFLKKLILPLFIFSFIFLALVPIIGVEVKGAKRWLDFYLFRLQPIEL